MEQTRSLTVLVLFQYYGFYLQREQIRTLEPEEDHMHSMVRLRYLCSEHPTYECNSGKIEMRQNVARHVQRCPGRKL